MAALRSLLETWLSTVALSVMSSSLLCSTSTLSLTLSSAQSSTNYTWQCFVSTYVWYKDPLGFVFAPLPLPNWILAIDVCPHLSKSRCCLMGSILIVYTLYIIYHTCVTSPVTVYPVLECTGLLHCMFTNNLSLSLSLYTAST